MTAKELYDRLKRIPSKEDVQVFFCPSRKMEEMDNGEWRWKDCVKVDDIDLEHIDTCDGWNDEDERNLILLPEEE